MTAALVVALVAPFAGVVHRRLVALGAAVAVPAWVAVAIDGAAAGRFAPSPAAAAVAAGTCALGAATTRRWPQAGPAAAHSLAIGAASAGIAAGYGDPSFLPVVAGLTVAIAGLAAGAWLVGEGGMVAAASAALGVAAIAVGIRLVHGETGSWALLGSGLREPSDWVPFWLIGGATLVAGAGALRAGLPGALLVAPGLAVAVSAAVIAGGSPRLESAYAAAALIVAVAGAAGRVPMRIADPATLGALAVAVAAVEVGPGAFRPAAMLIGAGAAIAAALPGRGVALAALPGAAAAVPALVAAGSAGAWVVGAAGAACAGLLAFGAAQHAAPLRLRPEAVPALAVGAWLVVAPGSWRWVGGVGGPVDLAAYDRGAPVAVSAGLVAAVAAVLAGAVPAVWPRAPGGDEEGGAPAWSGPLLLAALAVAGAAVGWLVMSAIGGR